MRNYILFALFILSQKVPLIAEEIFGGSSFDCLPVEIERPTNWKPLTPSAIDVVQYALFGEYTDRKFNRFCIISKNIDGRRSAWIAFFNLGADGIMDGFYLGLNNLYSSKILHTANVSSGGEAVSMTGTHQTTIVLTILGEDEILTMETIVSSAHRSFFVFKNRSVWSVKMQIYKAKDVSTKALDLIASQIDGKPPQKFTIKI